MRRRPFLIGAALLAGAGRARADDAQRRPLLIPGKTSLFQRVIARPGATLVSSPGGANPAPVPGFSVFYVYARQGTGDAGFLEVGAASDGRTQGWIPAAKAIDWKHTMIAAFTNPAGRKPVLFLDSERSERLLMLDRDAGAKAAELRAAVAANRPGPVVATEPPAFVDINRNFYLLPILDAELVERESGPPLRLLKVISAPAEPPARPSQDALRSYKAAVVFLIDTTSSMQPYIDRTREALRNFVRTIGETGVKDNFRFGVVAYRDSLEDNPGLEYPTKVFARPDFSKPPDAVLAGLDGLRESRVSSTGFDEDPLGGLKSTLDDIDWTGLSARYVILITDAGARPANHPHSLTRMGITELRLKAQEQHVAVMALHLLTPEGARRNDHEPAAAQYRELTQFNGTQPLYFPIPGGTPAAFGQTMENLVGVLLQNAATATGVPVETLRLPQAAPSANGDRMRQQLQVVSEAMRLSYVGQVTGARAPDVTTSWTTDRDLADPSVFALEVRLLLTRNQLSDLAAALQTILSTGLAGRTSPATFFDQLRAAFAAAATDPQRIGSAQRLGGLLGEYLDDLPYKSEIMDIDQESWLSMGPIAQRVVLNNVESRLRLYQEFQAQPQLWHDLTHSGGQGEQVYAVPLEALP